MKIKFLGHSTFQIEINQKTILVDPFISGNPLLTNKDINAIDADFILVTHAHQDHTLDVEQIAKNSNATVIANWEIATYYGNKGIKNHPMNTGGSWQFDFGTVKLTPAVHSSSFPDGTYGGNPNGFIIAGEHKKIYISGDTALFLDMQLIAKENLDLAILPLGDNFTMGIDEAILASDFINCDKILGCHFDTFGYIEIDHETAIKKFFNKGKDLMLLDINESIEI
ncbi:MAG: metal-dependent hydrolase [Flavobacterium sp.]